MFGMMDKQPVDPRAIRCETRGCLGTRYRLEDGEALGRTTMPGRRLETRTCQCDQCERPSELRIQVRISPSG